MKAAIVEVKYCRGEGLDIIRFQSTFQTCDSSADGIGCVNLHHATLQPQGRRKFQFLMG
jgi:hypothetical protein